MPHLRKIYVVASTEFGSAIRTKSFLIGILLLPVIMGASILIQLMVANRIDTKTRAFAVLDQTGSLYDAIQSGAAARNVALSTTNGKQVAPRFEPSEASLAGRPTEVVLLELSDRVRRGELYAFVEIPATAADPTAQGAAAIRYFSDNPNDDALLNWLSGHLTTEIRARRYRAAGIDPAVTARLDRPVFGENLGLLTRDAAAPRVSAASAGSSPPATAGIKQAERVDKVRSFAVPAILMFVVFMVVMTSAPQLLNSVIEEKMSRISEVLLGSLTPFELMMGKLLGNVAIAMVLASLYVGGGYGVACYYGYGDVVTPGIMLALGFFLVLAVFLFGSLYSAVGSACSELKDAQSLMMPVMLLSMLPAFFWTAVVTNPSSPLSVGMSLFPPSTPFLMLMRLVLRPAPPAWQVSLSVVLTTITAIGCVWAAGKVFRTGLLMQGKAPSFRELARWVMAK